VYFAPEHSGEIGKSTVMQSIDLAFLPMRPLVHLAGFAETYARPDPVAVVMTLGCFADVAPRTTQSSRESCVVFNSLVQRDVRGEL